MRFTLYPYTNLSILQPSYTEIHVARPLSLKQFRTIFKKCPNLMRVTASLSTKKRLGRKIVREMKEKGIDLDEVQERGRAIEVPMEKIKLAIEMRKDLRPYREIEKSTGIPKSTIHYLVKYSPRIKIKQGDQTILLG